MAEDDIIKLIPKLGDRAAIKDFCKRHHRGSQKESLIGKLKLKLQRKNDRHSSNTENSAQVKNKVNFRKKTRCINIGWLCANKKDAAYRHVRSSFGGGTRRKSVLRSTTCREILDIAKELYFPNGVSKKGPIKNFDVELLDFSRARFDDLNMTVQEIYDASALTDLRFYIATKPKIDINSEDEASDNEFIPAAVTSAYQQQYNLRSTSSSTTEDMNSSSRSEHQAWDNGAIEVRKIFIFCCIPPKFHSEIVERT